MNAQPGDLVECIDDKPSRPGLPVLVEKGKIYLVRGVGLSGKSQRPAYYLEGVFTPGKPGDYWPQSQYRFKKVPPKGEKKSDWVEKLKKLGGQPPIETPDEGPKIKVKEDA